MSKITMFALGGVGVYVAMIVITTIVLHNHDVCFPFLRALLWPISLTRLMLGGF
jgi:hypothetical protein